MTEILILAAGASTRMRGADKLMQPVDGEPLIRRTTRIALATGLPVTVALAPDHPLRRAALEGLAVMPVQADLAAKGMAHSLHAGLAALPPDTPVLLMLADLPDLTVEDLQTVLRAAADTPDLIHRGAAQDGTPGHPVWLPAWTRPQLAALTGDEGARRLLRAHADRVRLVPLPGNHATTDLDTPEDWAAWRLSRGQ